MQNNENEVIFLCPEMEDVKISCIAIRTWKGISLFLVLIFGCTFPTNQPVGSYFLMLLLAKVHCISNHFIWRYHGNDQL